MADLQFTEWDLLKLHDTLTLVEAACVIIGSLPARLEKYGNDNMPAFGHWEYNEWQEDPRDMQLETVTKALMKAVRDDKGFSLATNHFDDSLPNPWTAEVKISDLKNWLISKNLQPAFFFGEPTKEPDYMNPNHPRYSAKLAASARVWQAMEDEELTRGKSTITAMEEWLETRYKELDLLHEGQRNNTAIKECAKVANWNIKGGATKTPEPSNPPTPLNLSKTIG